MKTRWKFLMVLLFALFGLLVWGVVYIARDAVGDIWHPSFEDRIAMLMFLLFFGVAWLVERSEKAMNKRLDVIEKKLAGIENKIDGLRETLSEDVKDLKDDISRELEHKFAMWDIEHS